MSPKKKALLQLLLQLAAVLSGVFGLRSKIKEARADQDRLAMADAIVTGLGLITGTALAVRALRKGEDDK